MSNISSKLVKVMEYCGYILKNGVNGFYKYKYASASDVLEKVNAALVKYGLACLAQPELLDLRDVVNNKGATEHLATVKVKLIIVDAGSGETVELYGLGSGQDQTDKKESLKHAKSSYARYVALNIHSVETIEFRLFRSTLKHETFIAALQLVETICRAAISMSDEDLQKLTWSDFIKRIAKTSKPELIKYLKSKGLFKDNEAVN